LFVSSPTGVNFQWFKVGLGGNPDILLGSGVSQAVFASGDYYALVTDINGCTRASFPPTNIVVKDSVTTPTITQVGTISPCNNKGTITLTSSSSTNNQWSTGATSQSITVESSGTFTVTVSNDFCSKISKPLVIEVTPGAALELKLAPKIYTPGDNNISVNGGSDGEIDLTVSGGVNPLNFQWLDSSNTNLVTTEDITGLKKGWYKVIVTDANECSAKDSIYLKEPLPFKLPEGFTPNGDGKNDFFVIGAIENYPDNKFTVYNRWGNIVYDKVGYKNEWDGNANNGESMAEGTYFITLDIPGRDLIKGFVDLRR
jgi:gliding motility-associated-like protein